MTVGSLVQVIVQSKTSKVIKCELLNKTEADEDTPLVRPAVKTDMAQVTPHTLKPGFLVNAKMQKIFENGLEVSFLGGMTGTVFADHMGKSKYKVGEKVQAMVIS